MEMKKLFKDWDKAIKNNEMPYTDSFITSEEWIKDCLRKGLKKKSREFYIVKSVNRLDDGHYLIELEKEFKYK
jgi:hypothetical protein